MLLLPEATTDTEPSWFGFLLTVQEQAPFTRDELVTHLESKQIQTRMLFAGNLIKHPCFDEMRHMGTGYRVVGELSQTDRIMHRTFWIGLYPGMSEAMLEYMVSVILDFVRRKR